MKRFFCFFLLFITSAAFADTLAKPKVLPKAAEARWIAAVKNHKTKDGSTVSDVLAYVTRLRPGKFKAARFEVGYNGATGKADAVAINYWLGTKRSPGDAFVDLGYEMTSDGRVLPPGKDEDMASALEMGKENFLRAVDDAYRLQCRPLPDEPADC